MLHRYYLSEAAVSDHHGLGLTLQRVLGDDLHSFARFIHLERPGMRAPMLASVADRQLKLWELNHPSRLLCSFDKILAFVRTKTGSDWRGARRVREALAELLRRRWIKRAANHLLRSLRLEDSTWLVVPQKSAALRVMNRVIRRKRLPYVTWVMDDHWVRWRNGWHYPKRLESELGYHLRNARKVFVISQPMQQLYQERFGVASEVLFGPADSVGSLLSHSPDPSGPLRLAYFGSIYHWQLDALERLAGCLPDADATLDVFSFHDVPETLRVPRVFFPPRIPAGEVLECMRRYDGVVIPAGFTDSLRHLTELNISTKLSECFASGTVPVIVAPAYAAMSRFASDFGGAVVISDPRDPAQIAALRNLKRPTVRERVLAAARRVAERECSTAVMRRRWRGAWPLEACPHCDRVPADLLVS